MGFFYYSGHGAADGSTNYLIPIVVKTTETGELWDQSLRLTEIKIWSSGFRLLGKRCRTRLGTRKSMALALIARHAGVDRRETQNV